MQIVKLNQEAVNKAVEFLNHGEVVIFPTDTVYGFLADAVNKKAVEKIFKIKKRSKLKPLAIFVKNLKMAKELAEISQEQEKIVKKYWPGKYTFVLRSVVIPAKAGIQSICDEHGFWVKPGMTSLIIKDNKIALRIPKHKFLLDLLKKIGKPLVQTSVNISGQPTLTKISDMISQFGGMSDIPPILIIDSGDLPKSKPSTIIDLTKSKTKIVRK
jgi:L-threonylcarbamoyladenylate synthase